MEMATLFFGSKSGLNNYYILLFKEVVLLQPWVVNTPLSEVCNFD
ncbi:MAG: hypothetical protein JWR23_836 [Mucilaginibacter sp.]|nr:hypothetical protein [Mucilaginibacter sp.]